MTSRKRLDAIEREILALRPSFDGLAIRRAEALLLLNCLTHDAAFRAAVRDFCTAKGIRFPESETDAVEVCGAIFGPPPVSFAGITVSRDLLESCDPMRLDTAFAFEASFHRQLAVGGKG